MEKSIQLKDSLSFLKTEGQLRCYTSPYSEPNESKSTSPIYLIDIHFNIIFPSKPRSSNFVGIFIPIHLIALPVPTKGAQRDLCLVLDSKRFYYPHRPTITLFIRPPVLRTLSETQRDCRTFENCAVTQLKPATQSLLDRMDAFLCERLLTFSSDSLALMFSLLGVVIGHVLSAVLSIH